MNLNYNDYVVVNGKKYFADGGEKNIHQIEKVNEPPSKYDYITGAVDFQNGEKFIKPRPISSGAGHVFYERLGWENGKEGKNSTAMRNSFINGRNEISSLLKNLPQHVLDEYEISVDQWDKDTNKYKDDFKSNQLDYGFNNDNSQKVYYLLSQINDSPNFIASEKNKENKKIPLGANVTYGVSTFKYKPELLGKRLSEMTAIRNALGEKDYDMFKEKKNEKGEVTGYDIKDNDYSRYVDWDTGYKYITVGRHKPYSKNKSKYVTTDSRTIVLDKNNNPVPIVPIYDNKGQAIDFRIANSNDTNAVNYIDSIKGRIGVDNQYSYRTYIPDKINYKHFKNPLFENYNTPDNPIDYPKYYSHALGGPTTRLYAVGGSTGEQIPIGEQKDYNMVGAGGSHEENPQGGVPYGMNQDGSQNMVEEGEVSVGNNVFSDRIQLSPELCQQLGLPEGTTPAQAMQQIEQLYEQGQIGNDEFQEIQNIIFQDQESQKQGEEIQQEMPPNEGISPDMIQGANMPQGGGMPPEMMQQQGAPITPQNEGIQPEMVQGYAYGGRMW